MHLERSLLAVVALWGIAGCNDHDTDEGVSPASTAASLRIGQLSPDSSSLDACVAPTGTTNWIGGLPLLEQHGLPGGVAYGAMSSYIVLQSGHFDIRVVAGSSNSCATPLIADTHDVFLAPASVQTIVTTGLSLPGAATPLRLSGYFDDTSVANNQAAFRYIQASPTASPVTVALGAGPTATTLFTDVSYPNFGTGTNVDKNGYLAIAPLGAGAQMSVSTNTVGAAAKVTLVTTLANPPGVPANTARTAFQIGGNSDAPVQAPMIFLCADNAGPSPSNAALSDCIATNLVVSP
jgi:hypothetical protein